MGGIRMKARGSTVDLIIADENPGINEVPNGPIPVDNNDGIPCFPMAKMFCDGTNILRKRQDVPVKGDREVDRRQLKRFSLKELRIATDDFSTNNILGRGGYGVVYKGRLADGSLVAVKRLERSGCQGESEFQNEVETSSMIVSHRNLLGLRGFCKTTTERLLVYPYMANSSVAWWLRGRPTSDPPLDWPTRKRIALGCARGLSYLHDHCDPKIIHRDVKPANILLNEEFEAVVVDFGLAILMDCTDTHIIVDSICGTFGYMPLEYCLDGMCSEKIDVFGYGIMLLELITGQRIYDHSRSADDVVLADWVKGMLKDKKLETVVVDLNLDYNYVEAEVEQLLQVALLCTQNSPMDRPRMSNVMTMLECDGLAEIWYERQKVEILRQLVFDLAFHPNSDSDWSDCSTEETVELSGPMGPWHNHLGPYSD